eukprot:6486117-Amphidinium_carterae.1
MEKRNFRWSPLAFGLFGHVHTLKTPRYQWREQLPEVRTFKPHFHFNAQWGQCHCVFSQDPALHVGF